ncbi:MAG: putative immunogloblin, partial [Myxococcaceae bacterium]|nr:putative immunogloblin [Myxococcaceae bacterium]
MAWKTWRVVVASVSLLTACGDDSTSPAQTDSTHDAGAAADGDKPTAKPTKADSGQPQAHDNPGPVVHADGGVSGDLPSSSDASVPSTTLSDACDYSMQTVKLTADLVVPPGETVHVCPGTTFTASGDVKIDVLGALIVDGSADAPVHFTGTSSAPRSWHGIVIERGGNLKLTHGTISGAIYGMYAMAGSDFTVDHATLDTSFKSAIVYSNGSFAHTKFEAAPPPTIAITDAVSVDDPNGTLTIIDASPTISNSEFDGASIVTDVVRVGGQSSPTFDHVYLHGAHCGFHTSGGTNTSMHVTNSVFDGLIYGIMAYATKPIIEDSVFKMNSTDVGVCSGASADNAPVLKNNSYSSGSPVLEASCFMVGTTDPSPAATP